MNEQTKQKNTNSESFVSRHIRTITFLICLGIFLALFGPISIFTVKGWIGDRTSKAPTMTADELIRLMQNPSANMNLDNLQKYRGTFTASDFSDSYYIEFDGFLLLVVQNRESMAVETCMLFHMQSGESLNLKKKDVLPELETFLKDREHWKGTDETT